MVSAMRNSDFVRRGTMRHLRITLTGMQRAVLIASFIAAAPSVIRAIARGPDAGGYAATDATIYSFLDISGASGGTSILAGTDDAAAALTLPFTFQFYGHGYTLVCVSSNGALYFASNPGTCNGIVDFANTDLTTTATPGDTPALLPFWSDLSFQVPGAGAVFYQTLGAPGSRRFVVQWNNAYPDASANPVTFQAILSEGTNNVLFQYKTVALGAGNPATNGGQASIGIRDAAALTNHHQLQWSFDAPVLGDSTALIFSSASAPVAPAIVVTGGAFTYDGNSHAATATATGTGGAAVSGSFSFSYSPGGLSTPVNGGVYGVTASFTSTDPGYTNGTGTATITINRATPTITWTTPTPINEGTALSTTQLRAEVNATGTLTYTPPAGTLLNAGMQTLTVAFAPSNPANYNPATKAVTISVVPTPGDMAGEGQTDAAGTRYEFTFHVRERATGAERGSLKLEVERIGRESRANQIGEFVSTSLDQVVFSDDPRFRPGPRPKPTIDTATFSGVGRWNRAPGYTFMAQASDAGEPGRGRDLFAITIRSPLGTVVAIVNGPITAGNIQSNRVER